MRSSVVPHTMASETAQKTNWKNHFASIVAPERPAEREREPDRPVQDAGDREVRDDLGDDRARVLAAREADLEEGETGLHEHDEAARDDHPDRVDADGVGQSLARSVE